VNGVDVLICPVLTFPDPLPGFVRHTFAWCFCGR
jgi:hypothetical protein